MKKPVIVSGIQPSGKLHVGNYLGALKNFVALQNSGKYDCFFFIADYHALTEDFNPETKQAEILDLMADYLAVGLNPKKSILATQSSIPYHTELAWILSAITPMGELQRMTQFKDKSESGNVNAGLFTYPVLMAADILLYNASFVPTGNDQDQHVELTRTLARKFNSRFGKTFIEPKNLHTESPRVMAMDNPLKKMSKSQPDGCLFIDNSPEVMKNKIMRAVTDSGREIKMDFENKPGISNLLMIASAISGKGVVELEERFVGVSYADFKKAVGEIVADHFEPFRTAKTKLIKNRKSVLNIFSTGTDKASKIAGETLGEVKKRIGLA